MKHITILFFVVLLVFTSCSQQNSFTTEAGTTVTYLVKGSGDLPVDSLVSLFNLKYSTEDGKVIKEADSDNPIPLKINTEDAAKNGELYVVLSKLKTGDSVNFGLVAKDLFAQTFRAPLPDSIAPESKIQFQVNYLEQVTEEGYYDMMAEKQKKLDEKQLNIDLEILDGYLTENNIETQKTESGLRYVITKEGSGANAEKGQIVKVNYAGKLLDGPYFDTSIEGVAKEQGLYQEGRPYEPLAFELGQGRVIKGWDEGIALLNPGSEATLYIPSTLAYGSRSAGPIIKENSILVFDVELVGVE
ncbi:MAG: FKBP-type peptidyl-prolyl cis-trans isomerase [Bacteroidota bacterium]